MQLVFIVIAGLFCLKLVWNLATPWELLRRPLNSQGEPRRITLVTFVEMGLLAVAVLVSWLGDGQTWGWGPARVALFGGALFVASYLLLALTQMLAAWIYYRRRNKS